VRKTFVIGLASVAMLVVPALPAHAAAFVDHTNDASCGFDPGDVPAFPVGVRVVNGVQTIVETPSGVVNYTCSGDLPDGVSVPQTIEGYLPCFESDTLFVWAHYVVTLGGHLQYTCHFPPGSV
jgi:hypothetical protein